MNSSPAVATDADTAAAAFEIAVQIAEGLAANGPEGCRGMVAEFAVTATAATGRVQFLVGERIGMVEASEQLLDLVRRQREEVVRSGCPPWWRLTLSKDGSAAVDVSYDYGESPFPAAQLLAPEAYRDDLRKYPRPDLPLWLAAYIDHGGRQCRSPRQAVAAASRSDGGRSVSADEDLPPLWLMWSRWAVLAAADVAAGADSGAHIQPSAAMFETEHHSGSSLYLLPGDRAVLSGGAWDAPSLRAVYLDGARMPEYYAGAPDWVTDQVLNTRAASGLLSFCYWWEDGHWHRGHSPTVQESRAALPGVWSVEAMADAVEMIYGTGEDPGAKIRIALLAAAAEDAAVTPGIVTEAFGRDADIDAARYQLSLAGLLSRPSGVQATAS